MLPHPDPGSDPASGPGSGSSSEDEHVPPPPGLSHRPACPTADDPAHEAAHTIAAHFAQGWSLLCNGVVLFEDTGEIVPDGRVVGPHRWGHGQGIGDAVGLLST